MTKALDPVVESNRELLLQRSNVGVRKYGVTLADSNLNLGALHTHALEEALDLANYLQAAAREMAQLVAAMQDIADATAGCECARVLATRRRVMALIARHSVADPEQSEYTRYTIHRQPQ